MNDGRYSRQELFAPIGKKGQQSIEQKHAVIIGAGALGSSMAETLVRAGVGAVSIVDRDYVEHSNLNRQQLYTELDADNSTAKAAAAEARLLDINRHADIKAVVGEVDPSLLESFLPADIIIDALDNFETRMLVNDFACRQQIPFVYGACVGSYGLTYTILPGDTPCLHCLMEDIPMDGETCDTAGIIAPAVQMVSAHQAAEALKLLSGNEKDLRRTLLSFDVWKNEHRTMNLDKLKKQDCTSCGTKADYPYLQWESRSSLETLCGRDAVQIRPAKTAEASLGRLKEQHERLVRKSNSHLLVMEWEEKRIVLFADGRAIIHGETDKAKARKIYHQIVGG
ncbi:adenylyltransferase/sulfurtransferase [Sinobaca qinghaiensis]|uniref:Adenylyltransferase/sulfurtransferase n=1 Tax=Sinobaca qinghaiensis TaxID=342944 RepID=A0A419V442_9BACL|nr:ThiF family adenylyltransferase [Sinobaca qinghaiensis]RKD73288.1 adenylyltransferase/sulfurtransferase [Sinobaca qinghaiensis]